MSMVTTTPRRWTPRARYRAGSRLAVIEISQEAPVQWRVLLYNDGELSVHVPFYSFAGACLFLAGMGDWAPDTEQESA